MKLSSVFAILATLAVTDFLKADAQCANGGIPPMCCANGSRSPYCCENNSMSPYCCENNSPSPYCCANGSMRPDCDPSGINSHAVVVTAPPRRFETTAAPWFEPVPTVPPSNIHGSTNKENEIGEDDIFLLRRIGLD